MTNCLMLNNLVIIKGTDLDKAGRNGTKYINEPHVGGETTEAIFTDMLGTSLGKVDKNGYSAIDKTSFGADSSDNSSFFTGKPYVKDLGYAFLFRNYRADMGKWLSQDLIGYPDGWNNFAYCCNSVVADFDIYGAAGINYITNPTVSGVQSDSVIYSGGNVLVGDNTGFYVIAHGDKNGISNTPTSGYIDFNKIVNDIKNAPGYNDYDREFKSPVHKS